MHQDCYNQSPLHALDGLMREERQEMTETFYGPSMHVTVAIRKITGWPTQVTLLTEEHGLAYAAQSAGHVALAVVEGSDMTTCEKKLQRRVGLHNRFR